VNWKLVVGGAQAGNEMIFECANSPFCSIATMDMGWDQLEVHMLSGHELLEGMGCFIIQALKLGAEPSNV